MFFVEYTEHGERKAINLAYCRKIETAISEANRNHYAIYIYHEQYGKKSIVFETKEELLTTFQKLMDALKTCQAHYLSEHVLCQEPDRS